VPCATHTRSYKQLDPTGCVPTPSKQPFRRSRMKNDMVVSIVGKGWRRKNGNFKTANLRGIFKTLHFKQNFPNLIHSKKRTMKWGTRTVAFIKRGFQLARPTPVKYVLCAGTSKSRPCGGKCYCLYCKAEGIHRQCDNGS
jgi:hypothetical protein